MIGRTPFFLFVFLCFQIVALFTQGRYLEFVPYRKRAASFLSRLNSWKNRLIRKGRLSDEGRKSIKSVPGMSQVHLSSGIVRSNTSNVQGISLTIGMFWFLDGQTITTYLFGSVLDDEYRTFSGTPGTSCASPCINTSYFQVRF